MSDVKVVATKKGYAQGRIRRPGDEFIVPAELVSKQWMKVVDEPKKPGQRA